MRWFRRNIKEQLIAGTKAAGVGQGDGDDGYLLKCSFSCGEKQVGVGYGGGGEGGAGVT